MLIFFDKDLYEQNYLQIINFMINIIDNDIFSLNIEIIKKLFSFSYLIENEIKKLIFPKLI